VNPFVVEFAEATKSHQQAFGSVRSVFVSDSVVRWLNEKDLSGSGN
jgi:hypothetical protein